MFNFIFSRRVKRRSSATHIKGMKINNKFKNSVFTMLFDNPDLLRELYCALEDVTLPPNVPVSINTLENVIYMDMYNDISFEINGKLVVLIEHQSTVNPNMALRMLLYITRVLEGMIDSTNLYSCKQVTIPWPEFFVLYNGTDPYPDEKILRLSDHFEKPQILGLPEKIKPLLELEVKVININEGKNEEITCRCRKLAEYSIFVSRTRDFLLEFGDKEKAIEATVKYCRKYDILKEFLEKHGREVLNMLLTEWNMEDAKVVWRREAREDGLAEGKEVGLEEGRAEGRTAGLADGKAEAKLQIAKNLLAKGMSFEFIHEITGIDPVTI